MKSYITGIGGVFFRASAPQQTRDWYLQHFGLESQSWGAVFEWKNFENPSLSGSTSWCPFSNENDYFGNPNQQYMINYRVRDIEELVSKLMNDGIVIAKEMESSDFGKFVWINDPDGNRIELWEPNDSAG
jgi:predicted enzyme related to lactoylglutathione lyase